METAITHRLVLPLLARTALVTGDTQNDGFHPRRGGHFIINSTAVTATPVITPTIQGFDPILGVWYPILVGAAISTATVTVLKVHPDLTAVANSVANDILPPTWRINIAVADADSMTYGISAFLRD